MAGQRSGKAPGKTPYAPGGAEVWSAGDKDYFDDSSFHRDSSIDQSQQQAKDVDRLDKIKGYSDPRRGPTPPLPPLPPQPGLPSQPSYRKGGIVGPNRLKWGSPKVSAPCKDTKLLKCY